MPARQMREACRLCVKPVETEALWRPPWILGLSLAVRVPILLQSNTSTCSFSLSSAEEKTLVQVRAPEVGGVSI